MKKLILVYGDLAAGKSTYSDVLSEYFSIPVLHKDDFKELLSDILGYDGLVFNTKLSRAAVATMIRVFEEYAKVNPCDLILESNFHEEELAKLKDLAAKYGYEVLSVVLNGDVDLLHERYLKRAYGSRHKTHLANGLTDKAKFVQYLKDNRINCPIGAVLQIDANNFDFLRDKNLLNRVAVFLVS